MKLKKIIQFIFELGHLKRIKHEGWRVIGINKPESVSEHSLRAAQIGYILAELEGYENPHEVCSMVVFHDIGECRVGDIHKIASHYIQVDEEQAVKDQTQDIQAIGQNIFNLWHQAEFKSTKAGILAKDADMLEQAFTAKEYMEQGHKEAIHWINNISKHLQSKSAKALLKNMLSSNPNAWWQKAKKKFS